ncbi:hypothetical protein OIE91_11240 [Streptomyces albidoflavus]|uniref:hypothetical protein n=1 Tax=Streptomyces albidoflavus TaxID=1886 RepID=UPI00352CDF89
MAAPWPYAGLSQEAAERGGPDSLRQFYADEGHKAGAGIGLEAGLDLGLKEGEARGLKTGMTQGRAQGIGGAVAVAGAFYAVALVRTYGPPLVAAARERYGRPRPAAPETAAPAGEETASDEETALDATSRGRTTTVEGDR